MTTDGLKLEVQLVEELGADAYVYGTLPGDPANRVASGAGPTFGP